MSWQHCRIRTDEPILNALRSLEASGLAIVVVEDVDGRVVGTLTDGDIRRALLKGAALSDAALPFAERRFTRVDPGASRADALDLMQSRRIAQIPVLDGAGRLVGMHTIHEVLGRESRPNWAVVMAGGRGERLRPLTDDIPKPMIRIAGRPILERIVLQLVGAGITRIFLAVHYMADVIESHFGNGANLGCSISYLREDRPLGTAGALALLSEAPTRAVLVLNGDIVTQFDVATMLTSHEREGHDATVGIYNYTHTVPFGVVDLHDGRVAALREKPSFCWPINAGIYAVSPAVVAMVPPGREVAMPAVIDECLARGGRVGAVLVGDDWMDVGRRHQLGMARGEL